MKTLPFIATILCILALIAVPANAQRGHRHHNDDNDNNHHGGHHDNNHDNYNDNYNDDMSDKLDEWVNYAEDLGYFVIESETNEIRESDHLSFDLGRGTYHAYAESSDNISDLDMVAYDERGREIDSDTLGDNYPIVDFTLRDRQEVDFEITVYDQSGRGRGEYVFVLAVEEDDYDHGHGNHDGYDDNYDDDWDQWDNWDDWNWDDWDNYDDNWNDNYDDDWDNNYDDDRDHGSGSNYIESRLSDLYDQAYDDNLDPVTDEIGETYGSETYSYTLSPGYYVVLAAGGDCTDDLDLHVSDNNGYILGEDTATDDSPAVWFNLNYRTTVEIEVEVWGFSMGCDRDWFCMLLCED